MQGGGFFFVVERVVYDKNRKETGLVVLDGTRGMGCREGKVLLKCYASCWNFSNPSNGYNKRLPGVG